MFSSRKRTKVHIYTKNEVLLNNIIEKDFQNFLKPLNFLQNIYGYPKYLIRDNFVTPNGFCINILSFIATCLYIAMIILRAEFLRAKPNVTFAKKKIKTVYASVTFFNFGLNSFGHLTNLFSNIRHCSSNVVLIIKLQEINNKMPRKHNLVRERNWNLIYGVIFLVNFYALYGYLDLIHRKVKWIEIGSDFVLFSFYVNILYAARVVVLIKTNILLWIEELEKIKRNELKTDTRYWKNMFDVYSLIMDAYNIYNKVFQELILYFVVDSFLHTLIYIQMWLNYTQTTTSNNNPTYRAFLSTTLTIVIVWILSHLVYVSYLGRETEQIYIAMEKTQLLSSRLLGKFQCDEAERRLHKNVRRLYRARFGKLTLRGLFEVDAALTPRLVQVVMANVIVLLQFAFM